MEKEFIENVLSNLHSDYFVKIHSSLTTFVIKKEDNRNYKIRNINDNIFKGTISLDMLKYELKRLYNKGFNEFTSY